MNFISREITYSPAGNKEIHDVYYAGLRNGALLHRFDNIGGVPWSAIYEGRYEMMSCERFREDGMIECWNNRR